MLNIPEKTDPKRDPNVESYPNSAFHRLPKAGSHHFGPLHIRGFGVWGLGFRV